MQLVGVRPQILARAHVDGYRFVRLNPTAIQALPMTPLEKWKLQIIRTADEVFQVFTRGQRFGGICPIHHICVMLRHTFGCATASCTQSNITIEV